MKDPGFTLDQIPSILDEAREVSSPSESLEVLQKYIQEGLSTNEVKALFRGAVESLPHLPSRVIFDTWLLLKEEMLVAARANPFLSLQEWDRVGSELLQWCMNNTGYERKARGLLFALAKRKLLNEGSASTLGEIRKALLNRSGRPDAQLGAYELMLKMEVPTEWISEMYERVREEISNEDRLERLKLLTSHGNSDRLVWMQFMEDYGVDGATTLATHQRARLDPVIRPWLHSQAFHIPMVALALTFSAEGAEFVSLFRELARVMPGEAELVFSEAPLERLRLLGLEDLRPILSGGDREVRRRAFEVLGSQESGRKEETARSKKGQGR